MTSLLVGCGLPGGMMGSMMADLKGAHGGINMYLRNSGKKEVTLNELLIQLFEEVQYVWPRVGNPPLVTPFSQYVKNISLMNLMQMAQGKPRFSQIDKNSWDMLLGKTGKLPGTLAPEILDLIKQNNYDFFTDTPQNYYPDELPKYIQEMEEMGWERGQDDEELFELAMHDRQYRDYKTGVAKKKFEEELQKAMQATNVQVVVKEIKAPEVIKEEVIAKVLEKEPNAKPIVATVSGTLLWELVVDEPSIAKPIGTSYKEGDTICYICAYFGNEEIKTLYSGKLCAVIANQGDIVKKGDILAFVN
jgi:pyruvate carboxylase subunit B